MRLDQANPVPLCQVLQEKGLQELGLTRAGAAPDSGVVLLVRGTQCEPRIGKRWMSRAEQDLA